MYFVSRGKDVEIFMRAHCRPHTPATRVLRSFVDPENAGIFLNSPLLSLFYFYPFSTSFFPNLISDTTTEESINTAPNITFKVSTSPKRK